MTLHITEKRERAGSNTYSYYSVSDHKGKCVFGPTLDRMACETFLEGWQLAFDTWYCGPCGQEDEHYGDL